MSTIKATPFLEEMLHLVTQFLRKTGHQKEAQLVESKYTLPEWVELNNPLLKKGLTKIIKEYVKNTPKIQHYYENRAPEEEQESEEEKSRSKSHKNSLKKAKDQSPKVHFKSTSPHQSHQQSPMTRAKAASPKVSNTSGWMSKFQQPKRLEDINDVKPIEKVEQLKPKTKKQKQHDKKSIIESSIYASEEDSFELEPKKKQKKQAKAEKKQAKKAEKVKIVEKNTSNGVKQKKQAKIIVEQEEEIIAKPVINREENRNVNGYKKFFSRINPDEVGPIKEQLRDNSFHAKARYGQTNDDWGQFGYEKLKQTRGDSFKKTKGKLKNKAFQGALGDMNKINSIPIF